MKNTKIWFSGEFTCQVTTYTDGVCYWQVTAPGMMKRSGHVENAKSARSEINAAKARMLSKRNSSTPGAAHPAYVKVRGNRMHGRDNRD